MNNGCSELLLFPSYMSSNLDQSQGLRQTSYLCYSPGPSYLPPACPFLTLTVKYLRKHVTKLWKIWWNLIKTLLLPSQWAEWLRLGLPGTGPTAAESQKTVSFLRVIYALTPWTSQEVKWTLSLPFEDWGLGVSWGRRCELLFPVLKMKLRLFTEVKKAESPDKGTAVYIMCLDQKRLGDPANNHSVKARIFLPSERYQC